MKSIHRILFNLSSKIVSILDKLGIAKYYCPWWWKR